MHAALTHANDAPKPLAERHSGDARRLLPSLAIVELALAMFLEKPIKSVGTLLGVVFAVVLSLGQTGFFFGLIQKNLMLVENVDADLWIIDEAMGPFGQTASISTRAHRLALGTPGVASAEPILVGAASVEGRDGTTALLQLIGAHREGAASPFQVVAGDPNALNEPATIFLDDSIREDLGGIDLGDTVEVNGSRLVVSGFTWGLVPMGSSYAFASEGRVRALLRMREDRTTAVAVRLEDGASEAEVAAQLRSSLTGVLVLSADEYRARLIEYVLTRTPAGVLTGGSAGFGALVGFVIVALSMFSSVSDSMRELGTLKAVGARQSDLVVLLMSLGGIVGVLGGATGVALVELIANFLRTSSFSLVLPHAAVAVVFVAGVVLSVSASAFASVRLRTIDPAMVFK